MSIQIDFICHLLLDYCYQKIKVDDSLPVSMHQQKGLQGSFFSSSSSIVVMISLASRVTDAEYLHFLDTFPTCKETIDTDTRIVANSLSLAFDHRIEHKTKFLHRNDFNHFLHLCVTVIKNKRSSSINSLSHVNVCLLSFGFPLFFLFTTSILPLTIRSMIKKRTFNTK